MKRWIFIIALFMPIGVYSQIIVASSPRMQVKNEPVDSGAIRVTYEFISVQNPEKPDLIKKDYMALEIGASGISRYYSDNKRRMDSILVNLRATRPTQASIMKAMKDNDLEGGVGDPQEVYKNYPTGKISVTNPIAGTVYYYEDALNGIQWQIETDTATILSYICQKAVADFRGRHFTAWFAPDLPINDGPWKFMGLPGLILAVEDADKYFCFRAMSLENSTRSILVSKGGFMKATREEVAKVQKRFAQNPVEFLSNSLGSGNVRVVAQDENGIEKSTSELKFPYNPIELE